MEGGDKYWSVLNDEEEAKSTAWRHGAPLTYDDVNLLFEQGRTKTWEMELSHKTRLQDFKSVNPDQFKLGVNGREGIQGNECLRIGSYNALLLSSLPDKYQFYKAEEESFESSHETFRSAFPRGSSASSLAHLPSPSSSGTGATLKALSKAMPLQGT
ncbi:hypothetical protein V2J09_006220 [Rumex salicifolius]